MHSVILVLLCLGSLFESGSSQNCSATGWEKVEGVKPEFLGSKIALFRAVNSKGIVKSCFERCNRMNCTNFVIDFKQSVCYAIDLQKVPAENEFVPDANSAFFHEICIKVPDSCKRERLWHVERTTGAVLIDPNTFWVSGTITRSQCYEKCIEAGQRCKSAQFRTTEPLSLNNTAGSCYLSMLERATRPQAYRASMYRDEYLEDQCRNSSKTDYCSYSEFQNLSLPYSDAVFSNISEKACEEKCNESEEGFICRGYTIENSTTGTTCLLHSESTVSLGLSSLQTSPNVIHKEREPCLDLKVQCRDQVMTIELRTTEPFHGRIYASGFSETCGAQGLGKNSTILMLPLPKPKSDIIHNGNLECGLHPAFSINENNKTKALVWATVVIQFNPIIQRLGDHAVRVGCSLDDGDTPLPKNISVQSSYGFLDPNAGVPPISSTVVNVSSDVPIVTMRILDERMKDAVVTQVGQKLLLKIEIKPSDGLYDIAAGHLVASSASGGASYLILDELGCPSDPTTFPALSKDPTDNRSLISTFTAFKFPDSQLVKFNVVVRFCLDECEPATCRGGIPSYGRRRRSKDSPEQGETNATVTEVLHMVTPDVLPLQLSIIVQNREASADPLSSRENGPPDTVLIAGANSRNGLLCVDASLALGLLIFWLIIQILLIAGCLLAITQFRKTAIRAEEDRADILARHLYGIHGGNFEIARRVRWADRDTPSPLG